MSGNNSTPSQKRTRAQANLSPESAMALTKKDLDDLRAAIKSDLKTELTPFTNRLASIELKVLRLDKNALKNNLIIHGIEEKAGEKLEDLITATNALWTKIGVTNILMDDLFRIGKVTPGTSRPIRVKLVKFLDKRQIFTACSVHKLREDKIFVNDDLTKEDQPNEKILREKLKTLKTADPDIRGSVRQNSLQIKKDGKVTHRFKVSEGAVVSL